MSEFGVAPAKKEGEEIPFDDEPGGVLDNAEQTYWIETAYTKAQYKQLAEALKDNPDPLVQELQQDFAERAINGYGKGF